MTSGWSSCETVPSLKACFPLLCAVQFLKSAGVLVATGYMWALVPEVVTYGDWNECQNSDYEYFEIPILFTIDGLETEAIGFITNYGDKVGVKCKCDKYFHEEFEKFKEKKPKKALDAINELIKRNPYNENYIKEKEKLQEKLGN